MATTAIWPVYGWIGAPLNYADDPEKTENTEYTPFQKQALLDVMDAAMEQARKSNDKAIQSVLEYATDEDKTEMQYFVSGVNCVSEIARQQMNATKKRYHKESGIVAFHGYQSFAEGEVSAATAHKIGVELAERLWGDRFEVVIATHLNTKHYHNHFVLNSVSFADGLRYYDQKKTYLELRRTSDEICRKYGLSIIENPKDKGKHYAEWEAEKNGLPTWRTAIRDDVNRAVSVSMTWNSFIRYLKDDLNYEVKLNVKHVAIRPPGKERFVRLRSLGDDYTEEAIRNRILRQRQPAPRVKQPETRKRRIKMYGSFKLYRPTFKAIRALYYYYISKLRKTRRQPQSPAPFAFREDQRYFNMLVIHFRFLNKNGIDTAEQLIQLRDKLINQLTGLTEERRELHNHKRREGIAKTTLDHISKRLAEISVATMAIHKDIRLCGNILIRSEMLQAHKLQAQEEQVNKEKMQREVNTHESIGRGSRSSR